MTRAIILFILAFCANNAHTQLIPGPDIRDELKHQSWSASWVKVPGVPSAEPGLFLFRNALVLDEVPGQFIIHVSADNRYKLYVNGQWIGLGPARSDAFNWIYETYDLAPYLRRGKNRLSAEVWNFGELSPLAQVSRGTGFIVQADGEQPSALNTPGSWQCRKADAVQPLAIDGEQVSSYYVVGPGIRIDGTAYPWDWQTAEVHDKNWHAPQAMEQGKPGGTGYEITYALTPRTIPAMELQQIDPPVIRKVNGRDKESISIAGYTVPAETQTSLLLDQGELVTAYPGLKVSGGKGAKIRVTYAEALYDSNGMKRHRDSIDGMVLRGNADLFISDGDEKRNFTTLWFRTYRYIKLEIETGADPLVIDNLSSVYTAYPYMEKAYFQTDSKMLDEIWETGWRTARLCANETFFDCPYYEQAQYAGDTRIQALVGLYVSGDDRLMRKAIRDFYHSMIPEGLTMSRYPVQTPQVIPPYSLFWVSMIHDYLWHRSEYMFAAEYLVSIQHVLQWFENRIDNTTGMLGPIDYWPFVDWAVAWKAADPGLQNGVPPGAAEGNSSVLTLQYATTLDQAADIFSFFGLEDLAETYTRQADELVEATRDQCWDNSRGLMADTPGKNTFSQHANSLALLAHAIPKSDRALFMEQVLRDTSMVQATLYFRYYVNRAAIMAGLGNKYLDQLKPWERMIEQGLTTFAEITDTEKTRSDCHAWSASPLYEFLATVAGIRPAAPGFRSVIIEPHPGDLEKISAGMPHENGMIKTDLSFDQNGNVKGTVTLPPGLRGVFVWDDQTLDLEEGQQKVSLSSLDSRFGW